MNVRECLIPKIVTKLNFASSTSNDLLTSVSKVFDFKENINYDYIKKCILGSKNIKEKIT